VECNELFYDRFIENRSKRIKTHLEETGWEAVKWINLSLVAGSCEHSDEPTDFINAENEHLSSCCSSNVSVFLELITLISQLLSRLGSQPVS
jgi:hypothetical protein